ncbi:hypothetical protein M0R89_21600 (plasmid) [Halorussus limi]|uniref:CopG family transcriptional regulator n=1 Tax=Halorussus limi TaxID=2938695 RepID=A0A8U0I0T7_9EURY|nr:hypothetical protein [Halorussus limi]UPV76788.1 hypothetical protein M0R89_21600 [Halorussus limi]
MGPTDQTPPKSAEQSDSESADGSSPESVDGPSPEPTRRLAVPDRLVSRVERRLARTDFDSPEAYVAYVLEEVLAQVESEAGDGYDRVDGDEVEDRLQSLGYLD